MKLVTPMSRYSLSLTVAFVVTGALFYIMQAAIEEKGPKIPPTVLGPIVDIGPRIEDKEPEKEPPKKKKPPRIEPPPVSPTLTPEGGGAVEIGLAYTAPKVTPDTIQVGFTDGDQAPLMRVAPEYPQSAAARGIEGWVIVEFALDELGRVQAPRVIQAQPQGIFDREALKAVSRYKYKPRVINGQAVPVYGLRQKINFNLT